MDAGATPGVTNQRQRQRSDESRRRADATVTPECHSTPTCCPLPTTAHTPQSCGLVALRTMAYLCARLAKLTLHATLYMEVYSTGRGIYAIQVEIQAHRRRYRWSVSLLRL